MSTRGVTAMCGWPDRGVANLIESLGAIVGVADVGHSLSTVRAANRLRAARTCYDHLAGALGVAVYDAMVSRGYLDDTGGVIWAVRSPPGCSVTH